MKKGLVAVWISIGFAAGLLVPTAPPPWTLADGDWTADSQPVRVEVDGKVIARCAHWGQEHNLSGETTPVGAR